MFRDVNSCASGKWFCSPTLYYISGTPLFLFNIIHRSPHRSGRDNVCVRPRVFVGLFVVFLSCGVNPVMRSRPQGGVRSLGKAWSCVPRTSWTQPFANTLVFGSGQLEVVCSYWGDPHYVTGPRNVTLFVCVLCYNIVQVISSLNGVWGTR